MEPQIRSYTLGTKIKEANLNLDNQKYHFIHLLNSRVRSQIFSLTVRLHLPHITDNRISAIPMLRATGPRCVDKVSLGLYTRPHELTALKTIAFK